MKSDKLFLNSPSEKLFDTILKGEEIFLFSKSGKKYMDMSGGFTSHAILGWGNKKIQNAMINQIKKISHTDYKSFLHPAREKLSKILLSKCESSLSKIYLVSSTGGEACEVAMKMSFQYHQLNGCREKKYFISRQQSYHGCTTDSISLGDRKNLNFYKSLMPKNKYKINEHNIYRHKRKNETEDDYAKRSAHDLEKKILSIGPEKICGFVGETIMGGLVGDVPPAKNYWKYIRKICSKYNVHLILDEVWCGTGTSGKIYCIDWDGVNPDLVFMGKTLSAGYAPISAVAATKKFENLLIKNKSKIEYSNTHQGHLLGVVAALEAQKIIHEKTFLKKVQDNGNYLRKIVNEELRNSDFFFNIRGRGLRNSVEYKCKKQHLFGIELSNILREKHKIFLSGKWHRIGIAPAINIRRKYLNYFLEIFIKEFLNLSSSWTNKRIRRIKNKSFF